MTNEEMKEDVLLTLGEHAARGKPIVIATWRKRQIGETFLMHFTPTPLSKPLPLQWVRVTRSATLAEYLQMPDTPGDPIWHDRRCFFYEVQSD